MLFHWTPLAEAREMKDFPVVKLRSLDKITARSMSFEAEVGATVKFGGLYIKVQACRKAPPIEQPESAAFLQIWEASTADERDSDWVFSGWMFASSPGLSFMDHPIYDVWVLDCLSKKGECGRARASSPTIKPPCSLRSPLRPFPTPPRPLCTLSPYRRRRRDVEGPDSASPHPPPSYKPRAPTG
jgi:hypothetical protein